MGCRDSKILGCESVDEAFKWFRNAESCNCEARMLPEWFPVSHEACLLAIHRYDNLQKDSLKTINAEEKTEYGWLR